MRKLLNFDCVEMMLVKGLMTEEDMLEFVIGKVTVEDLNALAQADELTFHQHLQLRFCFYRDPEFVVNHLLFKEAAIPAGVEECKPDDGMGLIEKEVNPVIRDALNKAAEHMIKEASLSNLARMSGFSIGFDAAFRCVEYFDGLDDEESAERLLEMISTLKIEEIHGALIYYIMNADLSGDGSLHRRQVAYIEQAIARAIDCVGLRLVSESDSMMLCLCNNLLGHFNENGLDNGVIAQSLQRLFSRKIAVKNLGHEGFSADPTKSVLSRMVQQGELDHRTSFFMKNGFTPKEDECSEGRLLSLGA